MKVRILAYSCDPWCEAEFFSAMQRSLIVVVTHHFPRFAQSQHYYVFNYRSFFSTFCMSSSTYRGLVRDTFLLPVTNFLTSNAARVSSVTEFIGARK